MKRPLAPSTTHRTSTHGAITDAQRRTAPCVRALYGLLSVCFDFAPAVLYFVEKILVIGFAAMINDFMWRGIYILQGFSWWFALSLYIYFGNVEDLTALVWIRRRAFPIRVFICVALAPVIPMVAFGVSFYERCRCFPPSRKATLPRNNSPPSDEHHGGPHDCTLGETGAVDETAAPTQRKLIAGALADDVGRGRVEKGEMPSDLWHSLMDSFFATQLNLQLAESTPGHRLFLFSALSGSLPLTVWITALHAVTTSEDSKFYFLYFVSISAIWINLYRLCRSFSIGALVFSMLLVRIDALTAGYNWERLMHDQQSKAPGMPLFTWLWLTKSLLFAFVTLVLYIIDFVAHVRARNRKVKQRRKQSRAKWIAWEVVSHVMKGVACVVSIPAMALACESLKLTTLVVSDAIQRPAPEFTPALAGLLSFVFRHTGKDGDTHDARTKHVMLAAARARKEQLIRMARDAPGGEVSSATVGALQVCACMERIAADPTTTAMDLLRKDDVDGVDARFDRPSEEPQLTRARCMRTFFIAYLMHSIAGTALPFIDVAYGSTTWSPWLQYLFLGEIGSWIFVSLLFVPSVFRYSRFRLETRRLTQLCPSVRTLDRLWPHWVTSYLHRDESTPRGSDCVAVRMGATPPRPSSATSTSGRSVIPVMTSLPSMMSVRPFSAAPSSEQTAPGPGRISPDTNASVDNG